ncbi:protein of unknown function [Hyphomicrobium sp. MC1]|nr:protein of unknown function [Hyphomicrobium sp. MC1]
MREQSIRHSYVVVRWTAQGLIIGAAGASDL